MAPKLTDMDGSEARSASPMENMKPLGIAIPILFATNKLSRKSAGRVQRRIDGYMELYFSPNPIQAEEVDLCDPGKVHVKAEALYRKHHVYGDHQFLIPTKRHSIERYDAPWDRRCGFKKIGSEPTTATYQETLQFLPCSQSNLDLFKEKLLTEPFYLEVAPEAFVLHVKNGDERFVGIPSQPYSPRCWHGFAHPVVTVESSLGHQTFHKMSEIPWLHIANTIWR